MCWQEPRVYWQSRRFKRSSWSGWETPAGLVGMSLICTSTSTTLVSIRTATVPKAESYILLMGNWPTAMSSMCEIQKWPPNDFDLPRPIVLPIVASDAVAIMRLRRFGYFWPVFETWNDSFRSSDVLLNLARILRLSL